MIEAQNCYRNNITGNEYVILNVNRDSVKYLILTDSDDLGIANDLLYQFEFAIEDGDFHFLSKLNEDAFAKLLLENF